MLPCQPHAKCLMSSGTRSNLSYRHRRRVPKADAIVRTIAGDSMGCCTSCGRAVRGGRYRAKSLVPGKRSMIGLQSGNGRASLSRAGRAVCLCPRASTGLHGSGKQRMGLLLALPRGEKDAGPTPTDRAKPGYKEPLLIDGRGVPLSVVTPAANVNEGPLLSLVLNSLPIVRAHPDRGNPHHLCLDAACDNAPARTALLLERYTGHMAPKARRPADTVVHPGGPARRWKVERTPAWHERFRRLVVNWDPTLTSRYAFLCLANALIAYRI